MNINVKFIFIVTPPYSGSTVLAKILNTSPTSMMLNPRGEGQWLIPSMCTNDRWNPIKSIDWPLVKKTWYSQYKAINDLVGNIRIIIEKSPPNLVRFDQLINHFPNSISFAFMRNPYAYCSSLLHRHYSPSNLSAEDRSAVIRDTAADWLFRAKKVKESIDKFKLISFTYENFCASPQKYMDLILSRCPELEKINCEGTIQVKDYPVQKVINQNPRQIKLLMNTDIDLISAIISYESDLVQCFGYNIK